jgi:hypothetical protein
MTLATREEYREDCIIAGTEAILEKRYGSRDIRHNPEIIKITREEFVAAFDALHEIVHVCPIGTLEYDLTNPPEEP